MYPSAQGRKVKTTQVGIGLVSAVFLITVVALLSAAVMRTVATGGDSHALDASFHRAFLAAQSGAQLGSNRVIAPSGTGTCGNWNWDLGDVGLNTCSASVTCESIVVDGRTIASLRSTGRCGVGNGVAERRILVRLLP